MIAGAHTDVHERIFVKREVSVGSTLFFGLLVLSGCTAKEVAVKAPAVLDKNHFKATVKVEEDSSGKAIRLSTVNGLAARSPGAAGSDNYVDAIIEKETGAVRYEVVNRVVYDTIEGRFHKEVGYRHPEGEAKKELTVIGREIECTDSHGNECAFVEEVKFGVDESLVKEIAKRYQPGKMSAWKYTLKSPSDADHRDGIFTAEIAGLVERVEEYRANIQ